MDVIQAKIERLRGGAKPRVMDVFAGCGGISLGFRAAGFEISAAVELDPLAARSHARNLHRHLTGSLFEKHAQARDMVTTEPDALITELGLGKVDFAIDVLVGGPPCQAFARVGRAKLREIAAHPDAFKLDDRAKLYIRYMDYIKALKPLAILMENVPDIINFGGHNIPAEMCETLESDEYGYESGYTLLNSAFYGVPQMRERCFLIAYRKELGVKPTFPAPTHFLVLPKGYEGSRQVALKNVRLLDGHYMEPAPANKDELPPAISAQEAIGDLPRITCHLEGGMKRGARRFTTIIPYRQDAAPSAYARRMREWEGFESQGGIADHVIRSLPRDYRIFRRMNPGDEYPAAHRHAETLFEEHLAALRAEGRALTAGSTAWADERAKFVPPYDPSKFPNKWWKLRKDRPVRTIMAHIGKDSYSHIHYEDEQARTISVREAARLHSFPDGFIFEGTMNPAFRQIGNAVPPLMANALATVVYRALGSVVAKMAPSEAAE